MIKLTEVILALVLLHLSEAFPSQISNPRNPKPLQSTTTQIQNDVFTNLIRAATQTLTSSDISENEIEHSYGSASQGQWICSKSAGRMQKDCLEGLVLKQTWFLAGLQNRIKLKYPALETPKLGWCIQEAPHDFRDGMVLALTPSEERPSHKINNTAGDDCNQNNIPPINTTSDNEQSKNGHGDSFQLLIQQSLHVLTQSDINKPDGSSSQGRWVDAPSAEDLVGVLGRLMLNTQQSEASDSTQSSTQQLDNEQREQWLRWMKNVPSPLFLDLTSHVHELIIDNHHSSDDPWLSREHLEYVNMSLDRYISRIACHLILLSSGTETAPLSLVESSGAHIYGKLLYGGVNRFRILNSGSSVRRVGEKRESMSAGELSHPSWIQLGGLERKYEALDIGPAAVLELTLLPRLWQDLPTVFDKSVLMGEASTDMILSGAVLGWNPSVMLDLVSENGAKNATGDDRTASKSTDAFGTAHGNERNNALLAHFQSRVGGLQPQIDAIIRRVLDGRSIYSSLGADGNSSQNSKARLEAEELAALGLQPVRGLLLYGKPGTGKSLLVREIARSLGARPPKIVAAPELLDKWVGGSERSVRELFREAEEELYMCKMAAGGDDSGAFIQSALHVIVIDEIDAVFTKRTEDSGSITRNSVVNQLLSKLDGVKALPNVLMIGMTNRRELLDDALLRPGRLEVQLEVPLPCTSGRREILNIHFGVLRSKGRLSCPLCCAIDGIPIRSNNDNGDVRPFSKRQQMKEFAGKALRPLSAIKEMGVVDLASDEYTGGFSGADIAGLVRNAGSIALARARLDGSGVDGLLITLEDVMQALEEVKS